MSGGSWDYLYGKVEEAADRLTREESPLRRALGKHLLLVAHALHDIEWTDSGDCGKGSEDPAIQKALGEGWKAAELAEVVTEAKRLYKELEQCIKRCS